MTRVIPEDQMPLDDAYNRMCSQREWAAIADEPHSWWSVIINATMLLAIAGALSGWLYFLLRG